MCVCYTLETLKFFKHASPDLALWLWRRERGVLLLHALLLGFLALGKILVSELGQKALPVLHPQFRVFGQLPFNHQSLMVAAVGGGDGGAEQQL